MSVLAVDIGGTKYGMAVFDGGRMVERRSSPTDREGQRDWMLGEIVRVATDWRGRHAFDRCGVGFGGPVDFARQRTAQSTHVGGWNDFPLAEFLRERLGLPVIVDNDANTAALGEYVHGGGRGCTSLFYMTLSTGIGGGFVWEGRVYRGADGVAGEIGHVPVQPAGRECLCRARGCLETVCGGMGLERAYGKTARELLADDAFLRTYVADLALGIKTVVMLFNPERIVLGGGISNAGDRLLVPLRAAVKGLMTDWSRARIDIVRTPLGDDNVLWGALELARELIDKVWTADG